MMEIVKEIEKKKAIAIVRGVALERIPFLCEALLEGGITNVEITMNSRDAFASIREARAQFGKNMLIGAGTVLDEELAKNAIEAGAQFLLSPNLDKGMIDTALSAGVAPIPGVLTPTEVVQAVKWGAPLVKLFPINYFGPKYVKDLLAPLDFVKMIAVGGVHEGNIVEYFDAGVVGVGLGSLLIDNEAISQGKYGIITEKAKRVTKLLSSL
jgi:2-dehydro-3-deoxyphosphogluconate aldolase / (4S)-4-hydroxy-2-oxoglutarate aldolase